MNGPFQTERAMLAPVILVALLARVTADHDELGRALVLACLHALGRLAPGRHRMTAAARASAERVVDRVHRLAAHVSAPTLPAVATGFPDRNVHVVRVRHRADGRDATAVHEPLLAGIESQNHVGAIAANELRIGAGGAGNAAPFADLELDVV